MERWKKVKTKQANVSTLAPAPDPRIQRELTEFELAEARREVCTRAVSDARTFDPIIDNISTLAGQAIILTISPDGSEVQLPRWQFWTLFCEYISTVARQMALTGRLRP